MHSQGQVKVMSYPYLKVTYTEHKLQDQVAESAAIAHSKSITFSRDQAKAEAFGSAQLPGGNFALSAFLLQGASSDVRAPTASPCSRFQTASLVTFLGIFWSDFEFSRAGEAR